MSETVALVPSTFAPIPGSPNLVISYLDSNEHSSSKSSPVVLLVPGIGTLASVSYHFIAPLLISQGYRVVAMDLRGLGKSSTDFADFAAHSVGQDILALILHLKLKKSRRVVVMGNSMAAAAAVWAASHEPTVISGVIFSGPFIRDHPVNFLLTGLLKALFGPFWGAYMWSVYYKSLFKSVFPAELASHIETTHSNLKEPGRLSALYSSLFASKKQCSDCIPSTTCPILCIMGSADPDFSSPEAEVKWIEANFAPGQVTRLIVDKAGHYPHYEYPQQCLDQGILPWLKTLKA